MRPSKLIGQGAQEPAGSCDRTYRTYRVEQNETAVVNDWRIPVQPANMYLREKQDTLPSTTIPNGFAWY